MASNKIPINAKPIEMIIRFVETYLVEENKSIDMYIKKDEQIKKINPGTQCIQIANLTNIIIDCLQIYEIMKNGIESILTNCKKKV